MIASLYVPLFTDLGIWGGLLLGLMCLPFLLIFSLGARTESGWLLGVAMAVLAAAVLGVAVWFGGWSLT